jgi:hypothetical protein
MDVAGTAQKIKVVEEEKDLRVTFDSSLSDGQ